MTRASRRQRVVMITPLVPEENPEHAGGVLISRTSRWLADRADVSVIVPDGPAVRRARPASWLRDVVILETPAQRSALRSRVSRFLESGRASRWMHHRLREDPAATRLLHEADVVDLQWQEQADLLRTIRRINPSARTVVTLHDVLSQQLSRAAQTSPRTGISRLLLTVYSRWAVGRVRRDERRLATGSGGPDALVVLSEKDAALLPRTPRVRTLPPPVDLPAASTRSVEESAPPTILFVAYLARWSNEQGLRWFLREVLPGIRQQVPDVRMRIAGGGIRDTVRRDADETGAELLGFVPDLAEEYARADVAVVPLLQGAGVKFKTLDALASEVPVVTTPVGAEGIGDDSWFAGVTSDPEAFADAVVSVLGAPASYRRRSEAVAAELRRRFGSEAAERALSTIHPDLSSPTGSAS